MSKFVPAGAQRTRSPLASHAARSIRSLFLLSGIAAAGTFLSAWRWAPESRAARMPMRAQIAVTGIVRDAATNQPLEGVQVSVVADGGAPAMAHSAPDGRYVVRATVGRTDAALQVRFRRIGYKAVDRTARARGDTVRLDVSLQQDVNRLAEVVLAQTAQDARKSVPASSPSPTRGVAGGIARGVERMNIAMAAAPVSTSGRRVDESRIGNRRERDAYDSSRSVDWNREQYDRILDNPFLAVRGNPRSTFSVDVDRSSYGNVRRFLMQGQLPPADAVRIEEMVNYFPYNLEAPRGDAPVVITTEAMAAPWQPKHQLVRIALQARRIDIGKLPPSNLVFLIDVSGSMNSPDKLPLVKESLRLLVEQLREQDRVAIVVYAGAAGLVLPSTSGDEKSRIMEAIDRLEAGGSTAGGAGLELAYKTAREHFERGGNNRVILATDGDFNVGPSSDAAMERLIESKRAEGTYLTILGYGTGNYQDAKMQKLARVGNGNAAYVDDIAEAKKVLVKEMGGTLVTVANDVKLQVEFNPARVASYRLIGYEDRILRDEDFRDDKKDAGDMGAGHSVTALYEVVPVGVRGTVKARESDPLRYAVEPRDATTRAAEGDELLHVSLRYKKPGESSSRLITKALRSRDLQERVSDDLRFAASVASFGMLLRDSEYKGTATAGSVLTLARGAMGEDDDGYRAEFVQLVERWRGMARGVADRPMRRDR